MGRATPVIRLSLIAREIPLPYLNMSIDEKLAVPIREEAVVKIIKVTCR